MAQSAPPKGKMDGPNASSQLVPPDERFWQRYSPHAEFPLSSAGSFVLHLLLLGILLLAAFLSALFLSNSNRSLPVEAVRLDLSGGGGGNPKGQGDGPNSGQPVEAGSQQNENAVENQAAQDVPPQKIDVPPSAQVKPDFETESPRFLQLPDTEQSKVYRDLSKVTSRIRVPDSGSKSSDKGKGGTGEGGGSGSEKGKGNGSGEGEGRGNLTQREKRMLRWSMLFNTANGQDYVAQLRGLGAILAIPVRENGTNIEYKIIRNLSARPAKLEDGDVTQLQRIYWIDNKAQSVSDVLATLGIRGLPTLPSHFVAFMPEELEKKLYKLEKQFLENHYRGKTEDDIIETKFQIRFRGSKYEPEVQDRGLRVK